MLLTVTTSSNDTLCIRWELSTRLFSRLIIRIVLESVSKRRPEIRADWILLEDSSEVIFASTVFILSALESTSMRIFDNKSECDTIWLSNTVVLDAFELTSVLIVVILASFESISTRRSVIKFDWISFALSKFEILEVKFCPTSFSNIVILASLDNTSVRKFVIKVDCKVLALSKSIIRLILLNISPSNVVTLNALDVISSSSKSTRWSLDSKSFRIPVMRLACMIFADSKLDILEVISSPISSSRVVILLSLEFISTRRLFIRVDWITFALSSEVTLVLLESTSTRISDIRVDCIELADSKLETRKDKSLPNSSSNTVILESLETKSVRRPVIKSDWTVLASSNLVTL